MTFTVKLFGLILVIIGALATYYTFTVNALETFKGFLAFISIIPLAIGLFLIVVKME